MAKTQAEILQHIARLRAAQTNLADYAAFMLDVQPADHHRVICNAIDELLDDKYDELIILAPPGSAKSHYTSVAAPSYFLGRFPKGHVLTASYSTDLAEKWGRRVRNIVASPKYQTLFDTKLAQDSKSAGRWATDKTGEFYAAGVGSGILGFRADFAVIDDPISGFEQAQSITQLSKIHGWYETDFLTRMKPQGKLVLICQRLARNDLAGYLIDRNTILQTRRQRVLTFRMEATGDPSDPLGRPLGARLWPEWFTEEMVTDAKRDDFKWRTLYQQEPPSDTGAWVSPDEIQIIDVLPAQRTPYLVSDLALSVNDGDYSVHLTCGVDKDKNIYVEDAWRERVSVEKVVDKHLALCATHQPAEALIDDDNAAKVYVQLLATSARAQGIMVPYKSLPLRGQNKETRAAPLRGWFKRGKVFLLRGPWNKWLVNELLQFPNAMGKGVDDGVDALSLLGRRLMSLAGPVDTAVPTKEKTWQDVSLNDMWEQRELKTGYRMRV